MPRSSAAGYFTLANSFISGIFFGDEILGEMLDEIGLSWGRVESVPSFL